MKPSANPAHMPPDDLRRAAELELGWGPRRPRRRRRRVYRRAIARVWDARMGAELDPESMTLWIPYCRASALGRRVASHARRRGLFWTAVALCRAAEWAPRG